MMKLVIISSLLALTFADTRGYGPFYNPYNPYSKIVRSYSDINPDGSYQYGYDTSNGISAQETGYQKPAGANLATLAQGGFQYTSPEGVPVQIQYVADENGFHPSGNLLPTPPPTPAAILRSIQYNEAQERLRAYGK